MKKILLDSSFLISAAKEKLDLFEKLQEYEILIPEQVINETFRVSQSNQSLKNKEAAELALKILYKSKDNFKKIDLGQGHTDTQMIKYVEENQGSIVATLDKEIKSRLKGKTMILRKGKKVEIV